MIMNESRNNNAGKWIDEKVNIYNYYAKEFGEKPSDEPGLAIMLDFDNTGEKSVSFIDIINVSGSEE